MNNWKYTCQKLYIYQTHVRPPCNKPFNNKWLLILPGCIRIARWYSWDGATCAPDFKWALKPSMIHDAIYQFAEDIARAWGCSVWRVLRFGDKIFREAMYRECAPAWGMMTYYGAVTVCGYDFHQAMRLIRFERIKL